MRLYVGNLPFSCGPDELRQAFEEYGAVTDSHVVMDRETGRSRGFGFIEMGDDEGRAAIEGLNGQDMDGRPLRVNEAQPREQRGGGGGGGGGWGGGGGGRSGGGGGGRSGGGWGGGGGGGRSGGGGGGGRSSGGGWGGGGGGGNSWG